MAREALLSRGAGRFVRQILAIIGPGAMVRSSGERPWASMTFTGLRVTVQIELANDDPHGPVGELIARIEQADYGVARYLVADIQARAKGRMLTVKALLIEQA